MSLTYTKDSENIYFLNDKNIAAEKSVDGVNVIPSLELFNTTTATIDANIEAETKRAEGIEEGLRTDVDKTTSDLTDEISRAKGIEEGLRTNVNTISSDLNTETSRATEKETEINNALTAEVDRATTAEITLTNRIDATDLSVDSADKKIDSLSATANDTFVHLTGDTIAGDLNINGFLTVNKSKVIFTTQQANTTGGLASFVWNGTSEDYNLTSTGTFNINTTNGASDIYIKDESLKTVIDKIALEEDTKVDSKYEQITNDLSDDIKLSVDNILATGYLTKDNFGIEYNSTEKKVILTAGENTYDFDASDFIKDGMVKEVALSNLNGVETILIRFNSDAENNVLELPVQKLVDVYKVADGEKGLILTDTTDAKAFSIDYDVIATKTSVDEAKTLIAANNDAITDLTTNVSDNSANISTLSTNLGTLTTETTESFRTVNERITLINSELTSSIDTVDKKVDNLNTTLVSKIENADTILDTKIDTTKSTLEQSITTVKTDLTTSITTNATGVSNNATAIENLKTVVDANTTKLASIDGRVTACEGLTDQFGYRLSSFQDQLDTAKENIITLSSDLDQLSSEVVSHLFINDDAINEPTTLKELVSLVSAIYKRLGGTFTKNVSEDPDAAI